jgi:hypothetical protein
MATKRPGAGKPTMFDINGNPDPNGEYEDEEDGEMEAVLRAIAEDLDIDIGDATAMEELAAALEGRQPADDPSGEIALKTIAEESRMRMAGN